MVILSIKLLDSQLDNGLLWFWSQWDGPEHAYINTQLPCDGSVTWENIRTESSVLTGQWDISLSTDYCWCLDVLSEHGFSKWKHFVGGNEIIHFNFPGNTQFTHILSTNFSPRLWKLTVRELNHWPNIYYMLLFSCYFFKNRAFWPSASHFCH